MNVNNVDTQTPEFVLASDTRFDPIRRELAAVENRLCEIPFGQNEYLTAATERLISAGGKRLRPAISLNSAGIVLAKREAAISLAAGVEMLHTATLVHDDLIDRSLTRRGAPTLNSYNSPAATVLTGDYLFARAASLVASTGNVRVTELFANTLMVILNGEINQRTSRWKIDLGEYYDRIYAKTGALFVLATEAAAELGQADDFTTTALVEFGRSAGTAFQIVDDVLDYSGDESQTGKPVGADLHQGLFTLPSILYALAHPDDPHLNSLTSGAKRDSKTIQALVDKVRASNVVDLALDEARRYADDAQRALNNLPSSAYTAALSALTTSIVQRCY